MIRSGSKIKGLFKNSVEGKMLGSTSENIASSAVNQARKNLASSAAKGTSVFSKAATPNVFKAANPNAFKESIKRSSGAIETLSTFGEATARNINKALPNSTLLTKAGIEEALGSAFKNPRAATKATEKVTEKAASWITTKAGRKETGEAIAKGFESMKGSGPVKALAGVGVAAVIFSNMKKRKGQQPNSQLYGQQSPYSS